MSRKKKLSSFIDVFLFGILGIIPGILGGLLFGVLIAYVAGLFPSSEGELPLALGAFFGMGVGAVVGGIFGGVIGFKK
jgi:hypothetical protein